MVSWTHPSMASVRPGASPLSYQVVLPMCELRLLCSRENYFKSFFNKSCMCVYVRLSLDRHVCEADTLYQILFLSQAVYFRLPIIREFPKACALPLCVYNGNTHIFSHAHTHTGFLPPTPGSPFYRDRNSLSWGAWVVGSPALKDWHGGWTQSTLALRLYSLWYPEGSCLHSPLPQPGQI